MGRPAVLASAALTLVGCTMGPDYQRPEVTTPGVYRDGPDIPDAASIADQPWWEVFGDPALIALVDDALRNNYNLRAAIARIEQARGLRAQARSGLFPRLGYDSVVSRGRNEFLGVPAPNGGDTSTGGFVGLTAFWELDIWGRIRRSDEAALARMASFEEDRRAVMLSLVSEVAQLYFQLLGLDLQMEIARRSTASFAESLSLFERRARGGQDSELPSMRARAALAGAEITIPQVEIDIAITENAINVLLGRAPGPIDRPRALADQIVAPEVPVGLPSQLLERRPDVRLREQQMIAANAEVGVALANYFPRLSLTGILGGASPELTAIDGGAGSLWSIAAGLTGPIFEGGRLKGQEVAARARLEEAIANYQQSVLRALEDVSDAIITREKLVEVERGLVIAVDSLTTSVSMSTDRFLSGLSGYFEVLEAQQQLFPAEQALATTRTQKLLVLVQLYRALGGGWNLADEQWTSDGGTPPPEGEPEPK
ncbi:MAG TPA: RND transporter [Phycisphaerales bacterium]|nr:RND transporter [Phycisphaerales bacterium]